MKIYRIHGRCEAFKNCGMIAIDPVIHTQLTPAKKAAGVLARKAAKAGLKHRIFLQSLIIKDVGKPEIVQLFTDDHPNSLIDKAVCLQAWISNAEEDEHPF